MNIIDTIHLPMCTITIAAVPDKVSTLDELPAFLLPIRWRAEDDEKCTDASKRFPRSTSLAIYFSDVKRDVLKGNHNDTAKEKFLKSPAIEMMENAILYSFEVIATRKKVRELIAGVGNMEYVRTFEVVPFTPASRAALAEAAVFDTLNIKNHIIIGMDDGLLDEKLSLHLGSGVMLVTRPQHCIAWGSSDNRERGMLFMLTRPHNFAITRPCAPTIFKEFVTPEVLQQAFNTAVQELEKSEIGKAVRIRNKLEFIADDAELFSTHK